MNDQFVHFGGHDPLSNHFFDVFRYDENFVLLNELRHVHNYMMRFWDSSQIDAAGHILDAAAKETLFLLKESSCHWAPSYETSSLILDNAVKPSIIFNRDYLLRLTWESIPVPVSKTMLVTSSGPRGIGYPLELETPVITSYLLDRTLDYNHTMFIEKLREKRLDHDTLRAFYGIVFLINIWQLRMADQLKDSLFWMRSASLAYQRFNCGDDWAPSTMLSHLDEWDSDYKPVKSFDDSAKLASDRARLVSQADYKVRKGATDKFQKKSGPQYNMAKKFYEKNNKNEKYTKKTNMITGIIAFLNQCQYPVTGKDPRRTVNFWIKAWEKSEDKGIVVPMSVDELIDKIKFLGRPPLLGPQFCA